MILEVKSGLADFKADGKWPDYLPYCNQFSFLIPHALWDQHGNLFRELKQHGVGIITLGDSGHATTVQKAKKRVMSKEHKLSMLTRLAWRGGTWSKRNTHPVVVRLPT